MEQLTTPLQITAIRLKNIRGFRDLALNLGTEGESARSRTLVIGKNGTCKSTLLRGIAVGLSDLTDASKLISEPIGGLVSERESEGRIHLTLLSHDGAEIDWEIPIERVNDKEHIPRQERGGGPYGEVSLTSAIPFVCGYGAGRFGGFGVGPEVGRAYRIADSVSTLFNYQQPLANTELALRRLSDFRGTSFYQWTLRGIMRTLGLSEDHKIDILHGGGIEISGPSVAKPIRFEAWADGYRMTFSWIVDLYAWAMRAGSIDEEGHVRGILLIDEIEQHLHPSMQAEILPRLSEIFPKMQIFATTHSPLVALDAKPEELVVLRREGNSIVIQESVPDFSGYSAEDMLSDPRLFDSDVFGQETSEKLHEYRDLVSIPKEERNPQQRQKLRSLAAEVSSFTLPKDRESETTRILKDLVAKHNL